MKEMLDKDQPLPDHALVRLARVVECAEAVTAPRGVVANRSRMATIRSPVRSSPDGGHDACARIAVSARTKRALRHNTIATCSTRPVSTTPTGW